MSLAWHLRRSRHLGCHDGGSARPARRGRGSTCRPRWAGAAGSEKSARAAVTLTPCALNTSMSCREPSASSSGVAALTVSYSTRELTALLLWSLHAIVSWPELEIVVVDNG